MDHLTQSNRTIMVVDDTLANLELLSQILLAKKYQVHTTTNGIMALQTAREVLPDLILLDIKMPDMDGYEVCQHLKADEQTNTIPVIFISALDDLTDKVKGFDVGGVDYITKPFQIADVLARVKIHLTLRSLQKQLQTANERLAEQLQKSERLNTELQQRNEQLQQSLQTIKRLSGLVPICAWCHQTIRDKDGEWMPLETYIEDHSEAKFTHGMCPECLRKFQNEGRT